MEMLYQLLIHTENETVRIPELKKKKNNTYFLKNRKITFIVFPCIEHNITDRANNHNPYVNM